MKYPKSSSKPAPAQTADNAVEKLRRDLVAAETLLAATQRCFVREKERADALAAAISERTTHADLVALIAANIRLVSCPGENACGWAIGGCEEAAKAILVAGYRIVP